MGRAEDIFQRIKAEQEKAIDWFIQERETEGLFLDFKASANNGDSEHLHVGDKNNYAKAISGFGNSEGGVIVWGVDCNKDTDGADVAKAKKTIVYPKRFEANLTRLTSGQTVPPHNGVESFSFCSQDGPDRGYVVTHIPKWNYGVLQALPMRDFLVRVGSSFEKASHSYVAAQFGRKPQPKLSLQTRAHRGKLFDAETIDLEVDLLVLNEGVTVVRTAHFLLDTKVKVGNESSVYFEPTTQALWQVMVNKPDYKSIVSADNFKLAPKVAMPIGTIKFRLMGSIQCDFGLELSFGGEGGEASTLVFEQPLQFFGDIRERIYGSSGAECLDERSILADVAAYHAPYLRDLATQLFTPVTS